MTEQVRPPWTADQVAQLWRWQRCGWVHPFTCPNHGDEFHTWKYATEGSDYLTPTEDGWCCDVCGYFQDWAHDFMLAGPPPLNWPDIANG